MLGKGYGGDGADGGWREELGGAEIGDGTLDVFPGSALREDRTDDDFEAGAAGPPVLGTVRGEECVEVGVKRGEPRYRGVGSRTERGGYGGDHLGRRGGLGHLKGTIARAAGQVKKWDSTEERMGGDARPGGKSVGKAPICMGERVLEGLKETVRADREWRVQNEGQKSNIRV